MITKEELFPELEFRAYLNHAAMTPVHARALSAMNGMMRAFAKRGVGAWGEGAACRNRVREKLGTLIGASAKDIGLTQNTSQGIFIVANEFPWEPGDRLVLLEGEFPGNIAPWLSATQRFKLKPIWITPKDLSTQNQRFQEAMSLKPRLLAVSWVQYQSGWTQSLKALSKLRETHGIAVCLDAIQGCGALQMNLRENPLDFVTCGGHKWLMAPEGTGFVYVHPSQMERMRPVLSGWLSLEDPVSFLFRGEGWVDYQKPVRKEASRFEMASLNHIGYAGMEAALSLLLEQGPSVIESEVKRLASLCRVGLQQLGLPVQFERCDAGIVSFKLEKRELSRYYRSLNRAGVAVGIPDGFVRISPHFYNSSADIDVVLDQMHHLSKGKSAS